MSLQQVNFYRAEQQRQHPRFGALRSLQICLLMLVGMAVLGAIEYSALKKAQGVEARQERVVEQLLLSRNQVTAELLKTRQDSAAVEEIKRLETELGDKQQLTYYLDLALKLRGGGFTQMMAGLSEHHLEGVWLTGFHFTAGGEGLSLQGKTRQPELVAHYLQKLQAASVFYGKGFEVFEMKRDEPSNRQIAFELKAHREAQP
ncbi:PilN domain-containing protein [Aestuariirhabdus litorea]|uniref:MSHA biogenesis protein MshI n=1 Tax=Aestuariirhabdus litorea TaxID=2528527 RepID=A0A3P3VK51_9GAMM|nr:PilN domain-containing protein [Aestuariirhabdus litorea]RRJ83111.1 hypothetical protein D0544_14830 [Aestuariirhabdus litorea]RWW93268.1 hypothetical protein DZC74_14805 [Endozoicomonadaceae bacterium GTF-13]